MIGQVLLVERKAPVQPSLQPIVQVAISADDHRCHKVVQAACDIGPDVGVGEPADLVNDVDGLLGGQRVVDAVQRRGHDPHEAAVAVVLLAMTTRVVGVMCVLVFPDRFHGAASDVVGIAIRRELTTVQPFDEVVHDVGAVDAARAPDLRPPADAECSFRNGYALN